MSEEKPSKIVQATPFQRFTIRLVDGRFVRVPKPDLPATRGVDQSATSNQPEIRDLFRLVNGQVIRSRPPEPPEPAKGVGSSLGATAHPDPSFELPEERHARETK